MKYLFLLLIVSFAALSAAAQVKTTDSSAIDKTKEVLLVDAACGQCRLGLKGTGCDLAVKIGDKAYYVDGSHIDGHGDAHAEDGFCNAVRKAKVQGTVINNRFKATYFKLVTDAGKDK